MKTLNSFFKAKIVDISFIDITIKLLLGVILIGAKPFLVQQKTVESKGMILNYEVTQDSLLADFSCPTQGWILVGFNNNNSIVGADLKMFKIVNGAIISSDRIVKGAGNYPQDKEQNISTIKGLETKKYSKVRFSIPLNSKDQNDLALKKGMSYYLILAYSTSDDFNHHSRVREQIQIEL